ncbi:hypothetical protein NVP2275O_342 [Vibrio phage 2.275.O._10N.286.54.E11]|nr:hypothetical protein NVP2275O_342 [Vibrio phage 2.275.O._10N.286.54.E11]
MSNVYYRITSTEGETKGKFSNGGTQPTFKKVGKIWAQRNHAMAHLSQLSSRARSEYRKAGAVIEEFIPEFQETLDITEYLDMTNSESLLESMREFFIAGKISSQFFLGVISEDENLIEERKLVWNRKKLPVDSETVEKTLPIHCFGNETAQEWADHQGYTNAPGEVKAMLMLEHEGSQDQVDRWIKMHERQQSRK